MSDPLDRDKFPERPDHPDFWKLSEVLLWLDGEAIEGKRSVPEVASDYVDPEVLQYIAQHRVGNALQQMEPFIGRIPDSQYLFSMALWTDAFMAGAVFQKRRTDVPD